MNKKIFLLTFLAALFTLGAITDASAQRYGKKKKKKTSKTDDYFDESGAWTQKLWYGTSGALNFSQVGVNASVFRIGLSPMVGYKVTPWLSAGPRFSVLYQGYKGGAVDGIKLSNGTYDFDRGTLDENIFKLNSVNFGVGIFARAKFLQNFFIQGELESYTSKFPVSLRDNSNFVYFLRDEETLEFFEDTETRTNTYLGGGYNSSMGLVGYEIAILFNLTQDPNSLFPPYEIRAGLTYNF